jgi:SPP1 family predicted phage head-tail adaptor
MATGMDQRIRFESRGTKEDPVYGTQPGDWTPVATVWAEVEEMLPAKAEKIAGIHSESRPVKIRCRWRSDVTSAMRVILVDRGNRVLKITSGPSEIPRRRFIEMMAEQWSTAGDGA